jgi:crotonobetainyl-CoA:carnitine CoA-transferase CaiB-like acyl-CoA transferase
MPEQPATDPEDLDTVAPEPEHFLPLRGIRVIDLTSNMSGPLTTMVLAEQGADVIKIEPIRGDLIRTVGTGRNGMSAYFANLNRGKRSLGVDLGTPAGVELVLRLSREADVFVQNFRSGVVERLGVGYDDISAVNPGIIYTSISGFGREGPLANAPAYDHVVQALAGFAALQSEKEGTADMVHQGVIDKATAYSTAQAITAALFARHRTGVGTRIDASMLDVAVAFLWPDGMMNHTVVDAEKVLPPVSRSFRVTPTLDGYVSLVTLTPAQWTNLMDALSPAGGAETDLSDTDARMAGGAAIMRHVREKISTMTAAEVVDRLGAADVPCAPVLALDEVHTHPQIVASRSIVEIDHPIMGLIRQSGPAPRFDGIVSPPADPAPALGQQGRTILHELGLGDDEIDALAAAGTIAIAD